MTETTNANRAVSIALCTYNGENYLAQQLDSILAQDYPFLTEIVCVDDNSSDSTWNILNTYATKHKLIKIHQNTDNLGFIKNFEKALSLTSNNFISIADQDDIWYRDKISALMSKIGDKIMVYSDNEYVDCERNRLGVRFSDKRHLTSINSCLSFALFNVISGHTILFNRKLLNVALPFPTDLHYDWWIGFCASQYGSIRYIDRPLVGYRQHGSNAVGGYGIKKKNKEVPTYCILDESVVRLERFTKSISPELLAEHKVLEFLAASYRDRSLRMRLKRIKVFWNHREELLLFKKRGKIRKMIYCIKAFWKYD